MAFSKLTKKFVQEIFHFENFMAKWLEQILQRCGRINFEYDLHTSGRNQFGDGNGKAIFVILRSLALNVNCNAQEN